MGRGTDLCSTSWLEKIASRSKAGARSSAGPSNLGTEAAAEMTDLAEVAEAEATGWQRWEERGTLLPLSGAVVLDTCSKLYS